MSRVLRDLRPFGLDHRAVAADSGAIGGDPSQEFQVIADTGEGMRSSIARRRDYAANIELRRGRRAGDTKRRAGL